MAQTPESRAIALLEAEAAIHRRYKEEVEASEQAHAARTVRAAQDRDAGLAHLATVALELLKHTLRLDEDDRPPEPEPAKTPEPTKSPRVLSREKVNALLSMLPSDLAHSAQALAAPELAQLLVSAKARRQKDHVVTLEREIEGRSS